MSFNTYWLEQAQRDLLAASGRGAPAAPPPQAPPPQPAPVYTEPGGATPPVEPAPVYAEPLSPVGGNAAPTGYAPPPAAPPNGYGPPSYVPGSSYTPYVVPDLTAPSEQDVEFQRQTLRREDQEAGEGIYAPTPNTVLDVVAMQPGIVGLAGAAARGITGYRAEPQIAPELASHGVGNPTVGQTVLDYEQNLTRRAERAAREVADQPPIQERYIPEPVRDFVGNSPVVGGLGAAKDEFTESGVGEAVTAGATKVIELASLTQQGGALAQRKIDEYTTGNPDATYGALDPRVLGAQLNPVGLSLDVASEDWLPFQEWLNDPANKDLILEIGTETGFEGLTGGEAVYEFFRSQQGLAGVLYDTSTDIAVTGEVALGLGAPLAAKGAIGAGKAVGRAVGREVAGEAVGQAAATGIRRAADVADAILFDPLRIPGAAVRGVDTALGAVGAPTISGTASNLYERVGLSAAGRQQRALGEIEGGALGLEASVATQPPTQPWLFERDAAGNVIFDTSRSPFTAPVVRDPVTGQVRPVRATDMRAALEIMARLPHERDLRLRGAKTTYERMADDWIGLASLPQRATGLPRMVETLYPSRGPLYRDWAQMVARRIQRFGQEAIDAHYTSAADHFDEGMRQIERLNRIPPARRRPDWGDQMRRARALTSRAAFEADLVEAAMQIAGRADAKASQRAISRARWRQEARHLGRYPRHATRIAASVAGATAPAGGAPARLTWADLAGVVDDQTRAWADTPLSDGRLQGDVVLSIRADLSRLQELARQAVQRNGQLDPWDTEEFAALTRQYAHLFPEMDAAAIAALKPQQMTMRLGEEARRQIGADRGLIDPKTGQPAPVGIAAQDHLLGKAVRALDKVSATYRKYQLYNPLNIVRYSGLQAFGNAVTLAIGDTGALLDYGKAIAARARNRGQETGLTPIDTLLRDAGLGPSPFVKSVGNKDELTAQAFKGSGINRVLNAGRRFAGAFDTSLREAAYMHRFQPRYRALQMAQVRAATRRAAGMGVALPPGAVEAAIKQLDALHPYRAWSPSELKQALAEATGTPRDPAVTRWADRVARDYANATRQLHKDALGNVRRLGFSFEKTNADKLLARVFMYHMWSSRANMLYTREMLGNPALLNAYVSLWRAVEEDAERHNRPEWLRGMAAFMQTPLGLTVFTNPAALFNTFAVFNPEIMGGGFDANLTDLGKARQRSPFMVNPVVDQLLLSLGLYGSGAQATTLMPISFGRTYDLITWWNANSDRPLWTDGAGNPVPPPYPLRDLGGRAVSQILAEKISSAVAPELRRLGLPADVMQFGDLAATQQQDLVYLMTDIVRAQHPGLPEAEIQALVADEMFDPSSPVYQEALDRYASRLTAGMPTDQPIAAWLIGQASPFPILPRVASRDATEAEIGGYFDREADRGVWHEIVEGVYDEPLRIGGFSVPPPSLFTEVELGGTVITPEQLAGMSRVERIAVANEWFEARHGRHPAADAFPEDAYRISQMAKAASPADLALQRANDRSWAPGTPEQNYIAGRASDIRTGNLAHGDSVEIAGTTYTAERLQALTDEERSTLARAWLIENDLMAESDAYYAAKDALVAEHPDLGGVQAMQELAASYPGGAAKWVADAIRENPDTYGQYAARLDPRRYPPGSEDWVKEMLSLEAYQALHQQRPSATAPLAWENPPGAPVIPGLSGAASLAELYRTTKAEEDAAFAERAAEFPDRVVAEDMGRIANILAEADAYDAEVGNAPGASRGAIMAQIVAGDWRVAPLPKALRDRLDERYPSVGEDGETYPAIPLSEKSWTRQYILWALAQPEGERDPALWAAYAQLERQGQERADGATVVTDPATGKTALQAPEEAVTTAVDPLAGLSITRSADGSGSFLTSAPAPPPTLVVSQLGGTLYEGPGSSTRALLDLPPGTPLTVLSEQGGVVYVMTPFGLAGYITKAALARR